MKYLVTGGSGFLGSALVRRLVQAGHFVRVLDNQFRGAARRLEDLRGAWELVRSDVRDPEAVCKAVEGMDAVFHLAFINGTATFYSHPELVLEVGLKGMVHVLDACIRHRTGELFLASSSEVYQTPPVFPTGEQVPLSIPDPLNPRYSYAAAKIASEALTLHYGSPPLRRVVIFRPHNVYGPDMGWDHVIPQFALRLKDLAKKHADPIPFPIQGPGKQTRAFIYIDDFTDGVLLLAEKGTHRGIYNIGTEEEITVEALARQVGRYFKREIRIVPEELPAGSTLRRCPDTRKIRALGHRLKIPFQEGLLRTIRWYDEHSHLKPETRGTFVRQSGTE